MPLFTPPHLDAIRAAIAREIEAHHLPGVMAGVATPDGPVFAEAFGVSEIETGTPNDTARRHRIASVTKTMVGLCVMALVDEGRLSLDDSVAALLPEIAFHGPGDRITIRHLLTHTSGIGEAATPAALADAVDPSRPAAGKPRAFAEMFPDGIVVEAAPGTKWAYCNIGFGLLGEILERAERASLDGIMRRRIFAPLGMHRTDAFDLADEQLNTPYHRPPTADEAELLTRAGRPPKPEPTVDGHNIRGMLVAEFNKAMLGAGGVQSTLADMLAYGSALLRDGGGIVRPETFASMLAPHWCPDERLGSRGLAFGRTPVYGTPAAGHSGAYYGGWNTSLVLFPQLGLATVIFMNIMHAAPAPIFTRIIRTIIGRPAARITASPPGAEIIAAAPGVYEASPGMLTNFRTSLRVGRVKISARNGGLVVHSRRGAWKRGAPLVSGGGDPAFLTVQADDDAEPAHIALVRDGGGAVTGMRFDDLVEMRRAPAVAPWAPEE